VFLCSEFESLSFVTECQSWCFPDDFCYFADESSGKTRKNLLWNVFIEKIIIRNKIQKVLLSIAV